VSQVACQPVLHPIESALMLRAFLVAVSVTLASIGHEGTAQQAPPPRPVGGPGEIRGKLIDSATRRAVTTGSIAVRRAGDSLFVSGALPKGDGAVRDAGPQPGGD